VIRGRGSQLHVLPLSTQNSSSWVFAARGKLNSILPAGGTEVARRQFDETCTALPTLALLQFCTTLAIAKTLATGVPFNLLMLWMTVSASLAVFLGLSYFWFERIKENFSQTQRLFKFAPLLALGLASVWAFVPVVLAAYLNIHASAFVFASVGIISVVIFLSLIRLPISALLFATVVLFAFAYATDRWAGGETLEFVQFVGFGILALTFLVVMFHRNFVKQTSLAEERARDVETIKLLLNEFETGVGDWLWETDANGRLVYVSPRLAQILNVPVEMLYAETLVEALGMEANCRFAEKLKIAEPILNFETQTKFENIYKNWEISAKPVFNSRGFSGHRGVGRDVSLHYQQTQQIQIAKEEAEKANNAKSQFLAIISHELRTPINAIVGFSEVLSAGQGESLPMAARREYLGTILESAKHLQGLINDVLDATRMERGAIQLDEQFNDAAELIEVAVKILRDQALNSNVSLVAHVMDDVQVMSDLTRIKQVIINLITNAIKFSPAGGVVNIDMTRSDKNELIISIRDAGIGISKEDAERVFEPFVQVENGMTRRFGGIGLGLAIARKIARIHGGDLTLNGEVGVGTDARFTMPASRISWPKAKKAAEKQEVAA
jgi:signal transduction histidine kinase